MGKLADELKKRFKTPQEVARVLGIDPSLLSATRLAYDSAKKRGRDGALSDQTEGLEEAEHLSGQEYEDAMMRRDRAMEMSDGDPVFGDEDDDDEDDAAELRAKRRWVMNRIGQEGMRRGMSGDQVRAMLKDWPENALSGAGMGGALAEDIEKTMSKLEETANDWSEEELTGMGGSSTTGAGYEDSPKAGDRRKRARDRKQAHDAYGLGRLEPKGNELLGYGDRESPRLAMDEERAARDADSFAQFFPDSVRIRTNSL